MFRFFSRNFSTLRKSKKVKACVLDWSGTVCDKYVLAPALVFRDVFYKNGIDVLMHQVRKPMGLRKDLHIHEMLLNDPLIRYEWEDVYKTPPTEKDVQRLYSEFIPMQLECLHTYSDLIPGTREAIDVLRKDGIKIGSTTGFNRVMVDILEKSAEEQGVIFDSTVAGDDVKYGFRPAPHMLHKNLDNMNIESIDTVVKVDDTAGGIGEGLNAGCWTVGVSRYSNYMAIDGLEEEKQLSSEEIAKRNKRSAKILEDAGAHFVIDSIAELPSIIEKINTRLLIGIGPHRTQTFV